MKIFSNWLKCFNLYFSETLNFTDFKYVFRFFISFFDQTLVPSKVGLKWSKMGKNRQNGPTSEDSNFLSKKDMKKLNTYLKSAKFKVSEKLLKFFSHVEKMFIFFFFIFHFQTLQKNFTTSYSSTRNYLFNEVLLLIICFLLEEELPKMCELPELLEYTLVMTVSVIERVKVKISLFSF